MAALSSLGLDLLRTAAHRLRDPYARLFGFPNNIVSPHLLWITNGLRSLTVQNPS